MNLPAIQHHPHFEASPIAASQTSHAPAAPPTPAFDKLVLQIQAGGREAAAEFLRRYEPQLRRRIRSRLNTSMRRLFDSQDIYSTVCRRLDAWVMEQRVQASSLPELLSLLHKMTLHAIVDKARIVSRLQSFEHEEAELARSLVEGPGDLWADDGEATPRIERWLSMLESPLDREVFVCWLWGFPHNVTAEHLGVSHDVVRKRWQLIRAKLKELIGKGRDA